MTSPADVKARLDAERRGEPFLLYRDGAGAQVIVALTGPDGDACRNDASHPPTLAGEPVHGYCLVSREPGGGDPELIGHCLAASPSMLRFAGDLQELHGQAVFMICADTACEPGGAE